MEKPAVVEKHTPRETALQRLARESRDAAIAFFRTAVLSLLLAPVLLWAFLTADLPVHTLDRFFAPGAAISPSQWLTYGGVVLALAPLVAILIARRFGGDAASRTITISWGLAAVAVFFELSYLAPALNAGDFPPARFVVAVAVSAMAAQYIAVSVYDVARGGGRWWRAPLYAALSGYFLAGLIYFPGVYYGAGVPWLHWMVGDIAVKAVIAVAFLPFYGVLRQALKPAFGLGAA